MHLSCREQCLEKKAKHCYHTFQKTRLPWLGFERPSDAGQTQQGLLTSSQGEIHPAQRLSLGHRRDRTVPALTQSQSNLWELRGSSPAQQREMSRWLEELQSVTQLPCTLWRSLASTDLSAEVFHMNTLEVV